MLQLTDKFSPNQHLLVMETVKYSELLGEWLKELGYTHCFMLAGGGCMHLIDGFRSRFICIPVVHEVAAGIAVEHFNECSSSRKAFALVTTGPGMTNIITAIAGAYAERRELLVIAGQVKTTDLLNYPLRQRGIQEVDGAMLAKPVSVASICLSQPMNRGEFVKIVSLGHRPHPGPVVIEICLDLQGSRVRRAELEIPVSESSPACPVDTPEQQAVSTAVQALKAARRPLILLGGLVTRKTVWPRLVELERLGIPVVTTTSAIDRIPSDSPLNAGRTGTWGGQRSANLIVAQADVIIALGAQLDLQQTGFNWQEFAPSARLFQIYPCKAELTKGHPLLAGAFNADPNIVFSALLGRVAWSDCESWGPYVRKVRSSLPILEPSNVVREGFFSSFKLLHDLSLAARPDDALAICSSGGSFTAALQVYHVSRGQYATTSAALASMGYGLSTAIGVAFARPGQRVILAEGDGGFAQNLQELAVIRRHNLPIKIFLMDNGGYGSIRATQKKFFGGAYVGCDEATGLGFPDWIALFNAFGIKASILAPEDAITERLASLLASPEPEAWVVRVDPEEPNWPAVSSQILPDGKMVSNPLYNMLPPLPDKIAAQVCRFLPDGVMR
jgi:acetolactate synthase-1/2/3 large subunit